MTLKITVVNKTATTALGDNGEGLIVNGTFTLDQALQQSEKVMVSLDGIHWSETTSDSTGETGTVGLDADMQTGGGVNGDGITTTPSASGA
jgi:hypothetical protein